MHVEQHWQIRTGGDLARTDDVSEADMLTDVERAYLKGWLNGVSYEREYAIAASEAIRRLEELNAIAAPGNSNTGGRPIAMLSHHDIRRGTWN